MKIPTLWNVLERPRLRKKIVEILKGMRKHCPSYRLALIRILEPYPKSKNIFSEAWNIEMKFQTKARVMEFSITPSGGENCSMSYKRHDDD